MTATTPGVARVVKVRHAKRGSYTYIGRGSDFGNPFSHRPSSHPGVICVATRGEAIERYRHWLWQRIQHEGRPLIERLAALHGQTLGCYCTPLPCHGQVLAAAAAWSVRWLAEHPSPA